MDLSQQTRTRSPRILLRLLLVAGAAVVGWLLLSGGPAQADEAAVQGHGHAHVHSAAAGGPGAPADRASSVAQTVSKAVSPAVSDVVVRTPIRVSPGTVHAATTGVAEPVRDLPRSGTALLDSITAGTPALVRDTADRSVAAAVEPVLRTTTRHLAAVVDRTAVTADAAVDPVLQAAGAESPVRASTPTAPADVPSAGRHARPESVDPATTSAPADVHTTRAVGHDRATPSDGTGTEFPGIPSALDVPAAPVTSSAAGTGGMLTCALLPALALLRRRIGTVREPLPSGPAFGPGSSPD